MHLFIIHFAHDISETFYLPSVSFYFLFDKEVSHVQESNLKEIRN